MNIPKSSSVRKKSHSRASVKTQTETQTELSWSERMTPPAHMSDGAKAVWKSAIDSVSPDQLNELDRAALGAWATACDLYRQAQIGLDETGLVVKAPVTGTLVQSPYLAILNKQVSIIVRTATQLGFTPVSRARVKPVEAKIDPSNSWHDFVF